MVRWVDCQRRKFEDVTEATFDVDQMHRAAELLAMVWSPSAIAREVGIPAGDRPSDSRMTQRIWQRNCTSGQSRNAIFGRWRFVTFTIRTQSGNEYVTFVPTAKKTPLLCNSFKSAITSASPRRG